MMPQNTSASVILYDTMDGIPITEFRASADDIRLQLFVLSFELQITGPQLINQQSLAPLEEFYVPFPWMI